MKPIYDKNGNRIYYDLDGTRTAQDRERATAKKIAKICQLVEMRPGALDYREIPSMVGGEHVAYKGGQS